MEKAKKMLMDKGISPSLQRVLILNYLLHDKSHPTADEVYISLCKEIPTLSKTTVYNTLKLFASNGLIRQMAVYGNEAHYETDTGHYAHFQCTKCKKIYDIMTSFPELELQDIEGHQVEEVEISFRGICKECRED